MIDIFVAVMGLTGSGRSTFIAHCTDGTVAVGGGLKSCTDDVTEYKFQYRPDVTVHLIDTPGPDHSHQSEADVLRGITTWLAATYREGTTPGLHGIIYLHRISDARVGGSGRRSLRMLQELCGPQALGRVVLATTMWDRVEGTEGERREAELIDTPELWGGLRAAGAQIHRLHNNRESALRLLDVFVPSTSSQDGGGAPAIPDQPVTLAVQRELVDENKPLEETAAWRILSGAWSSSAENETRGDEETRASLRELQQETEERLASLRMEHEALRAATEVAHAERVEKLEESLRDQRRTTDALVRSMAELETRRSEAAAAAAETRRRSDGLEEDVLAGRRDTVKSVDDLAGRLGQVQLPSPRGTAASTMTTMQMTPPQIPAQQYQWPHLQQPKPMSPAPSHFLGSPPGSTTSPMSQPVVAPIPLPEPALRLVVSQQFSQTLTSNVTFSPDGKRMVGGAMSGRLVVWERDGWGNMHHTQTVAPTSTSWVGSDLVSQATFSPDGWRAATGSSDDAARLWQMDGLGRFGELQRLEGKTRFVCFLPNGSLVACGSEKVRLWEHDSTQAVPVRKVQEFKMAGPGGTAVPVLSMAASPDGGTVALGSRRSVHILSYDPAARLTQRLALECASAEVAGLAFAPDGLTLAATGMDDGLHLWTIDRARGFMPQPIRRNQPLERTGWYGSRPVAFSVDGTLLVTGAGSRGFRVWVRDPVSGLWPMEAPPVIAPESRVQHVGFHPDGRHLAVVQGSGTGTVVNYEMLRPGQTPSSQPVVQQQQPQPQPQQVVVQGAAGPQQVLQQPMVQQAMMMQQPMMQQQALHQPNIMQQQQPLVQQNLMQQQHQAPPQQPILQPQPLMQQQPLQQFVQPFQQLQQPLLQQQLLQQAVRQATNPSPHVMMLQRKVSEASAGAVLGGSPEENQQLIQAGQSPELALYPNEVP